MRRRARAKPAAVVDRIASGHNVPVASVGELADPLGGPLHVTPPRVQLRGAFAAILASGRVDPDPPHGERARSEVVAAERDRALDLLDRVERLVGRIGGFMTPEDQETMREVRAALVEFGRRVDERPTWTDRR